MEFTGVSRHRARRLPYEWVILSARAVQAGPYINVRGFVLALVIGAFMVTAVRWGSWVAGGSDSYCYVHQAERWADVFGQLARGHLTGLQVAEPLALDAPWPEAARTFAPSGHVPSRTVAGAIVPICPVGLSIAMAPFVLSGGPRAAFYVLPLFAAVLVAATSIVGSRFGARVGLLSSVLVAASPIVLYQVIQPMSDVPAAALWMLAVALATGTRPRSSLLSGLATSAAIIVRPNLVPLGITIGLFLLLRPERSWPQRLRSAATFALASAPGCIAVALTQNAFYGSPFASGYGSLAALFSLSHVTANLGRYLGWLWSTHTAAIALALLAPWLLPGSLTALALVMFFVNLALYVPYVIFEDWSYLRFLLPTIPLLLILVVAVVDAALRRFRVRGVAWITAGAVIVLAVLFVREARERPTFVLNQLEARFERAGVFVDKRLPPNALVITSSESGSVRFYAGRKTMLWDGLDPAWLDRALMYVRSKGYEPYLLFERREETDFRQRFVGSTIGRLDWPPLAEVAVQVRVYRPEDRDRYLQGTLPPTEFVP
jgi:hypothetical protein